jgi:hypothetical protein
MEPRLPWENLGLLHRRGEGFLGQAHDVAMLCGGVSAADPHNLRFLGRQLTNCPPRAQHEQEPCGGNPELTHEAQPQAYNAYAIQLFLTGFRDAAPAATRWTVGTL